MLRALLQHRAFIASLVRREFQLRSSRALWGNAWLVLEPATQIVIYTLIFGRLLGARLPGVQNDLAYGLYLCAGLITWSYFAELVTRSQTLFLDHADLLKTVSFPRSSLPVALLVAATVNFLILAGLFALVLLATGNWPGAVVLAALPLLALQSAMGLGLGLLTGTLNVFFRDVGKAVGVGMQFWFWLTPIVYPVAILPEGVRRALDHNPMLPIISGYHGIVLEGRAPDWPALGWPLALAALVMAAAWATFRRLSSDLLDEL